MVRRFRPAADCIHLDPSVVSHFSRLQLVVYYQCCVLIGCATSRLYAIAH